MKQYKLGKHVNFKYTIYLLIIGWLIFLSGFCYKISIGYCIFRWFHEYSRTYIILNPSRETIYPEEKSEMENICALVPNIQRHNLTWYCILIPFGILLLWLLYQTIFSFYSIPFLCTKFNAARLSGNPKVSCLGPCQLKSERGKGVFYLIS